MTKTKDKGFIKAAMSRIADVQCVLVPDTMSLSTPVVSSQDGPRMALSSFGGKRAGLFKRGGGRAKPSNAKRLAAQKVFASSKATQKRESANFSHDDETIDLAYVGFKKLSASLAAKGASNPGALAAWIGRRKYSAKRFDKAATKGVKLGKKH